MAARYENLGGLQQLVVESHEDLARVGDLDPARWAATSAPVEDLQLDPVLARALVGDQGARLRMSHLLAARDWLFARLAVRSGVDARSDVLTLSHLGSGKDGERPRSQAREVLDELGVENRDQLSLADLRRYRKKFDETLANGDGIVTPAEVPEPEVAEFAGWVLSTIGGREDPAGVRGVSYNEVDDFLAGAIQYREWRARPQTEPAVMPWGEDTAAGVSLVEVLGPKIEEWFLLADLLEQEGRSGVGGHLDEEAVTRLRGEGSSAVASHLKSSPLAPPWPDGRLDLDGSINPFYRDRFQELRRRVLGPVLGEGATHLDRDGWHAVVAAAAPHASWRDSRPPHPFHEVPPELLDPEKVGPLAARLAGYLDADASASGKLAELDELERLILLQRWILVVARNLVSFASLYDPRKPALFQMGTLIIDGRRLELTVRVRDRANHRKVAADSQIFLVYGAVFDADGKKAFEVAAPVTAGERGRIRIGKRGVLLGRDGQEWDVEVVDVIENPISLWEAVRSPFVRVAAFVSERVQALAASSLESAEKGLATVPAVAGAPPAPVAAEAPKSSLQNVAVMLSLATAALGSAAAFLLKAIAETNPLRLMGSLLGIVLLVAFTSGFLGWLRLRRRDMSLLLEANGWAVNVPMALTRPLGALFTHEPSLPGDKVQGSRGRILLLLVLILGVVLVWDEARLRVRLFLKRPPAAVPAPASPPAASPSAPTPGG